VELEYVIQVSPPETQQKHLDKVPQAVQEGVPLHCWTMRKELNVHQQKMRSRDTPDVATRAVTWAIMESGAGSSWKALCLITKPLTRLRKL
jgi:hypothetical protein